MSEQHVAVSHLFSLEQQVGCFLLAMSEQHVGVSPSVSESKETLIFLNSQRP
jgi:hypothetical protein